MPSSHKKSSNLTFGRVRKLKKSNLREKENRNLVKSGYHGVILLVPNFSSTIYKGLTNLYCFM